MTAEVPALVVSTDPQHGVAVYARDVAAAIAEVLGRDVAVPVEAVDGGAGRSGSDGRVGRSASDGRAGRSASDGRAGSDGSGSTGAGVSGRTHLHFTDRLWASSPEEAADRLERIGARTRLTVTLHDLPQPSDGERNLRRRADCYARVVAAAEGVVVNSRHEALLLAEHTLPGAVRNGAATDGAVAPAPAPVGVIPLPVTPVPMAHSRPEPDGSVAVLGFFYPGKGHAEVVDALAMLRRGDGTVSDGGGSVSDGGGSGVRAVVLGRPSPGHEGELDALVADAAARGVHLEVTGWLDDADLLDRCRRVAVPVATHRHVSASGSIATWIAAGRRPLVPATRYSREMAALRPGTLTLVDDDLPAAVARALDHPASTWIADDAVTRPDMADTAAAYLRWFGEQAPAEHSRAEPTP